MIPTRVSCLYKQQTLTIMPYKCQPFLNTINNIKLTTLFQNKVMNTILEHHSGKGSTMVRNKTSDNEPLPSNNCFRSIKQVQPLSRDQKTGKKFAAVVKRQQFRHNL